MNESEKRLKQWCLDNADYKIYKTLSGVSNFAAIVSFTFYKRRKEIADNISNSNALLKRIKEMK